MGGVEERLDLLATDVAVLTTDVAVLKADVAALKADVRGLHVLYEHQSSQIALIAEVQAHHGRRLDEHGKLLQEIRNQLEPLPGLYDFVRRVANNHETRLVASQQRDHHRPGESRHRACEPRLLIAAG